MKILVLTPDYPDFERPVYPFVKQLVEELAKQGHSIQVIAPYSLTHNKHFTKQIDSMNRITVYRPYYFSFSNLKIGKWVLSESSIHVAFKRGFKMLKEKPEIVYGHFWPNAYHGYKYAKRNEIPLFVATGESIICFTKDTTSKNMFCEYVSGVICVSTKNQEESIRKGLTTKDKTLVAPNAIDGLLFKKLDRNNCRKQLGFPEKAFIIAFVGGFNDRKGVLRLSEAISTLNGDKPAYSIFIGSGSLDPVCDNILFKGKLRHTQIPQYLNAADVFVLPTLHEGCCNAIVEAMACGLPVVSSDLPFNKDICDNNNSILIDPMNIEAIRNAIIKLRDDEELRLKLAEGALKAATSLSIDKRSELIISFMKSILS